MKKVCSKCKEEKDISEFPYKKAGKCCLDTICKKCKTLYNKEYHILNKEKLNAYDKKWRENNPGRHHSNIKKWKKDNPDRVKELDKLSRKRCKVKIKETQKIWEKNNPEKMKIKFAKANKHKAETLPDCYVASFNLMSVKEFRELPEEVQHIYRTSIKIRRVFKQQKENQVL
jgi:hypothetical protein